MTVETFYSFLFRAYQSATQDDLWQALTEEAHRQGALPRNMTVKQIMDTWTLQTGFPVIHVERNYKDGLITVAQVRNCKTCHKF